MKIYKKQEWFPKKYPHLMKCWYKTVNVKWVKINSLFRSTDDLKFVGFRSWDSVIQFSNCEQVGKKFCKFLILVFLTYPVFYFQFNHFHHQYKFKYRHRDNVLTQKLYKIMCTRYNKYLTFTLYTLSTVLMINDFNRQRFDSIQFYSK